jgi:hypothetical protein
LLEKGGQGGHDMIDSSFAIFCPLQIAHGPRPLVVKKRSRGSRDGVAAMHSNLGKYICCKDLA